jgi:hypothetical protein
VPTIFNPDARPNGGHAIGRVRVLWLCPPYELNVIGRLIALEPAQADLLERICAAHLVAQDELERAGALLTPDSKKPKVKVKKKDEQPAGE